MDFYLYTKIVCFVYLCDYLFSLLPVPLSPPFVCSFSAFLFFMDPTKEHFIALSTVNFLFLLVVLKSSALTDIFLYQASFRIHSIRQMLWLKFSLMSHVTILLLLLLDAFKITKKTRKKYFLLLFLTFIWLPVCYFICRLLCALFICFVAMLLFFWCLEQLG